MHNTLIHVSDSRVILHAFKGPVNFCNKEFLPFTYFSRVHWFPVNWDFETSTEVCSRINTHSLRRTQASIENAKGGQMNSDSKQIILQIP